MNPPHGPEDERGPAGQSDIHLSPEDLDLLLDEVARIYRSQAAMEEVLGRLRYPNGRIPLWNNAVTTWSEVFQEFDAGIIDLPYRRLLAAARRVYGANAALRDLEHRYVIAPRQQAVTRDEPQGPIAAPTPPQAEEPPADQPDPVCHVIVRASDENERVRTEGVLRDLGLAPHVVWTTAHALSFQVASGDTRGVRRILDGTDLGWTLVPPGQRDYLLSSLYAQGPDGRNFQISDVPAQQTIGNIAGEIVEQYPAYRGTSRPTVIDHVQQDGQGRRLDPDTTLDAAGIQDGAQLRVAFQATAGAVNPQDREDALYRARNQILAYAASHDVVVKANSTLMPTEYEVEFRERSFALNPAGGHEPVEIEGPHLVLIQLGPEFPMTPPHVFWLSPIFHPNVYPTYDSELARRRPGARGLVCLGVLSESYKSSMDFGELCQTLVDMAGFRNYGLFEPSSELNALGEPVLRGNYYDGAAAEWVQRHQDRVAAIGGQIWGPSAPGRASHYRNVIEAVDG
jgi:Effector-associated domain 1